MFPAETRTQIRLSPELQAHVETSCVIVLRQLFRPDDVTRIGPEFDGLLEVARDGKSVDGKEWQAVIGDIEKRRGPSWLLEDDRIFQPIETFRGPGFRCQRLFARWLGPGPP